MTSVFSRLRKFRARYVFSEFPPRGFLHQIVRIKSPEQIGSFAVDKVTIAMGKFRHEELPGEYKGREIQYRDEARKEFVGYLHYKELDGFCYQVFQGKGFKNVQFNPRHFPTWQKFEAFVQRISGKRPFHLTRVDFCWSLSKKYFSVAIVDWILWVKHLGIGERRRYKNRLLEITDEGSFHALVFGGVPVRLSIYDCDAFNLNSRREEEKKTHSSVNFEVMCRTKELRRLGIRCLEDLSKLNKSQIFDVLHRFDFFKPKPQDFIGSDLYWVVSIWKSKGLTVMARESLKQTNTKDYAPLLKYLTEVSTPRSSLKGLLVDLALQSFGAFVRGDSSMLNYGSQRIVYAMKPMFPNPNRPR